MMSSDGFSIIQKINDLYITGADAFISFENASKSLNCEIIDACLSSLDLSLHAVLHIYSMSSGIPKQPSTQAVYLIQMSISITSDATLTQTVFPISDSLNPKSTNI